MSIVIRCALLLMIAYALPADAALLAEYRFEEPSWNGTAGEVRDSSGSGRHGVRVGTAQTLAAGRVCRGGDFPLNTSGGTIASVNTGMDVDAQIGVRGTIAFWYRANDPWEQSNRFRHLLDGSGTSSSRLFFLMLNEGGKLQFLLHDSSGQKIEAKTARFAFPAQIWVHVAVTWNVAASATLNVYIFGILVETRNSGSTGALANLGILHVGDNGGGAIGKGGTGGSAAGRIDEVRTYNEVRSQAQIQADMIATHACGSVVDHFELTHDRFGIHCAGETVTVGVRDAADNPVTTYTGQITLDTQTGKGDWSLTAGSGALSNGTPNDGIATYQWPGGESSATFSLSYGEGTATFDIDAWQTNDTTIRDDDTEGTITFSATGFSVTSAALPNPPGTIPAFASPQTAGMNFAVHITAYGQTPTDTQCGVIESYAGAKNLKFWSLYANPATGTRSVTIDGIAIATSEAAALAQGVTFTAGQAAVTVKYKDVGQIQIGIKDDSGAHPDLPNGIVGGTGSIVVRPATFTLSTVLRADNGAANPGAADAAGPVFLAAGRPFATSVTARDAEGSATPNYGRESPAESVRLEPTLLAPAGGINPAVTAPAGFGAFTGGVAVGNDFSWPEVGIIALTPRVRDGSYLGAGDVSGTASGPVGRFVPDDFAVASNVPVWQTGCGAGGFTYIGQPFGFAVPPIMTITARAFGGATTRNYTGSFWMMTNASLGARSYSAGAIALDSSGLPPASSDPTIADAGNGGGTLAFSAGSGLALQRTTATAPVSPQILLSLAVIDSDGVAAPGNPQVLGNPGGIAFSAGSEQRYGRLAFRNAAAPELFTLSLPLQAQYYLSDSAGFAVNGADSCTSGVTLQLSAFTGALAAGETCVIDTGSPGASGAGCTAAGAAALRFRQPVAAGDFNLHLAAPGSGNHGSVTVRASGPAWLAFDWNAIQPGFEDATGVATFGVYQGEPQRIYQRENY